MSSDLIQRLQRLQHGFSAPCACLADARALLQDAEELEVRAESSEELVASDELSSAVASLLQQLAGLSRPLSAAGFSSTVTIQFTAASATVRSCAQLAERLPLQHNDLVRLASALAVVFEFGPVPLRYYTARLSAIDPRVLWIECHHQLAAASQVLQQAANPEQQPEAAAAFVRTAGRPQAVLPWLAALSQALLALPTDPRRELSTRVAAAYSGLVAALLDGLGAAYNDAMQQAPATQQAVLSVLLDRCLPLLAADCLPEALADVSHTRTHLAWSLASAAISPGLNEALIERLQQPQAAASLRQAVRVVASLPRRRGAAGTAGTFGGQHAGAALLLARLCISGNLPASTAAAASQQFVAALPGIAATLAALADDDSIPAEQLAGFCYGLQQASNALLGQLPAIRSDSQLAAWLAAADASVRLVPTLLRLRERWLAPEQDWRQVPAQLSQQLLGLLESAESVAEYVAAKAQAQQQSVAANKELARQLWALHTSMCRLMAWLAADPSGARTALLPQGNEPSIAHLLQWFSAVRYATVSEAVTAYEEGMLSQESVLGICVAHGAALQTAIQMLGGLPGCGSVLPHIVADLHSLSLACSRSAAPVDASLTDLFSGAIMQLAPTLFQNPEAEHAVTDSAGTFPRLAAAMARSGALQTVLAEARRLERSGNAYAAAGLAVTSKNVLYALDRAVAEAIDAAAEPTPQQQPLLRQLRHAAGASAGLECSRAADDAALVAQLPDLSSRLPAAAKLADLLHQWWQPAMQPERHAEAQLALAQAAATRSCAYLRCANLGGEGGPAAGQGVGSMRCSACRAVWYCGTACSHADWRAGHKRVCKALGAARRSAKEAAAAAAAEGQQGS